MTDEQEEIVEICDECGCVIHKEEVWDKISDESGEWQIVRWCQCPIEL